MLPNIPHHPLSLHHGAVDTSSIQGGSNDGMSRHGDGHLHPDPLIVVDAAPTMSENDVFER